MADEQRYRTILFRLVVSEIVILLIFIGSAAGFAYLKAQKPKVQTKDIKVAPTNVDAFQAAPVVFQEILTAYGTARPDREVIVAAQVTGEIIELHPRLRVGESVRSEQSVVSSTAPTRHDEGDVMLRIDPRDYQERVDQSQNRIRESTQEIEQLQQQQKNADRQLEKAREDLETLTEGHKRIEKLIARKAGSPADLNRSLLELRRYEDTIINLENQLALFPHQIATAEERLATSRSEFDRATNDLQKTWVYPPFNGFLSDVTAEQGLFVRAGEPLFRITDPDIIEIPVAVGLDDWQQIAGSVRSGEEAGVELAPGETADPVWTGTIARVAPEADPQSRTIQVFVEVDNARQSRPLLPGTFVHARIRGRVFHDQIVVPRTAIFNDDVFVIDSDNKARRIPIRTGRRLRSLVVIEEGLRGEERIATTNLDILENDLSVTVQQTSDLPSEMKTQMHAVVELLDDSSTPVSSPPQPLTARPTAAAAAAEPPAQSLP